MSGQRARSAVAADHRSAHPNVAGIPWWGAVLTAVFFLNLFVFRLRVFGPLSYLRLGPPGISPFLMTFPWTTLLVSAGAMATGLALLKRCEFSYKMNFLVLAIVLMVVVGVLGFLLDRIGFNERVAPHPPMRRFYREYFDEDFRRPLLPPPQPRIRGRWTPTK